MLLPNLESLDSMVKGGIIPRYASELLSLVPGNLVESMLIPFCGSLPSYSMKLDLLLLSL